MKKMIVLISISVIIIASVIAGVSFFKSMMHKAETGIEQLNKMVLSDIDLKKYLTVSMKETMRLTIYKVCKEKEPERQILNFDYHYLLGFAIKGIA